MAGSRIVDVPEGNARVTATRGFKNWFSTREAGLTVESTVSVMISCEQSESAISIAAEAAGELAEGLAIEGGEKMGMHMDRFARQVSEGLGDRPPSPPRHREVEEPVRRSEKVRRGLPGRR